MNKYRAVLQCTLPVIDAKVKATATMYGQNEDEVRALIARDIAFYFPEFAGETLLNPVVTSVTKIDTQGEL